MNFFTFCKPDQTRGGPKDLGPQEPQTMNGTFTKFCPLTFIYKGMREGLALLQSWSQPFFFMANLYLQWLIIQRVQWTLPVSLLWGLPGGQLHPSPSPPPPTNINPTSSPSSPPPLFSRWHTLCPPPMCPWIQKDQDIFLFLLSSNILALTNLAHWCQVDDKLKTKMSSYSW